MLKLVSLTLIENIQDELKSALEELDDLYFSVRYPQDYDYVQGQLPKDRVGNILKSSKELFRLLEKDIS